LQAKSIDQIYKTVFHTLPTVWAVGEGRQLQGQLERQEALKDAVQNVQPLSDSMYRVLWVTKSMNAQAACQNIT
jgi:hypothetical protein